MLKFLVDGFMPYTKNLEHLSLREFVSFLSHPRAQMHLFMSAIMGIMLIHVLFVFGLETA